MKTKVTLEDVKKIADSIFIMMIMNDKDNDYDKDNDDDNDHDDHDEVTSRDVQEIAGSIAVSRVLFLISLSCTCGGRMTWRYT